MFHQRLMELRKQHGLTQEQLGAVAGVSRQTVSKWELGETTPELEKLHLLCDYFRISMDELTGREPVGGAEAAPAPAPASRNWHYEYKSERMLWGLPLVHVNLGRGIHRAKGIIAIGNVAQGMISLGVVSVGLVSCGVASVGLLSLGSFTVGLLLSLGAVALGAVAIGAVAVGWFAVGGVAVGAYAIGGCAVGARIAAGGYAHAPIAIGDESAGEIAFSIHRSVSKAEFTQAVKSRFPGTRRFLIDLFYGFLR